jgi:two-component system chemotaxis response regulator CheB
MVVTKKIRILVVDDSAFMRKMLVGAIASEPDLEVVGIAKDGVEALKLVEKLKPDVVTLDIELPEIDGIACVAYIMEEFPTPIVIVTGFSEFLGEETIKGLEYGAVGLLRKPKGSILENAAKIGPELISQIKLASQVNTANLRAVHRAKAAKKVQKPVAKSTNKIVAIASSSGGPRALSCVIPKLPADLPAAVLVVQHMPAEFIPSLAKRLNEESNLTVKVAEDSESIQQGKVLIAPGDFTCTIVSPLGNGEVIRLSAFSKGKGVQFTTADEPMISLAPIYGPNAVGVVLTGMGNDGTEGLRAIKKYGGRTIAEHESSALINGMPRAATEAGVADEVVALPQMADEIVRTVQQHTQSRNEDIRIQAALSK